MESTHANTRNPRQHAILLSLSRGANRTTACHAAKVPRRTFYNWLEHDPGFREEVEDAEATAIGILEDLAFACAMKAAEDPRYLRALFFWLKHRAGWAQARPNDPLTSPAAPTTLVGATGPVALPTDAVPLDTAPPPSVGARHAAPTPQDTAPLATEHAAPAKNPGARVPSVPREDPGHEASGAAHGVNHTTEPPPAHTPIHSHSSPVTPTSSLPGRVPSVPSRQQDRARQQQFRKKMQR